MGRKARSEVRARYPVPEEDLLSGKIRRVSEVELTAESFRARKHLPDVQLRVAAYSNRSHRNVVTAPVSAKVRLQEGQSPVAPARAVPSRFVATPELPLLIHLPAYLLWQISLDRYNGWDYPMISIPIRLFASSKSKTKSGPI